MDTTIMYPKRCRENIRTIVNETGICVETAYAMMLMTATLMDLDPGDRQVAHLILQDCGIEDGGVA